VTDQGRNAFVGDVTGEEEERGRNNVQGAFLGIAFLADWRVGSCFAESPQQTYRAHNLDGGVCAEADEGHTPGNDAGNYGGDALHDVPADREVFQPQRPRCSTCRRSRAWTVTRRG